MTYTPPTQDEIERVAEYWARVKRLSCKHDEGFTFSGMEGGPHCSGCGEVIRFLTEEQIRNLRSRPEGLNGILDKQLERGGVRFAVNGEWHEARLRAFPYPGFSGGPHEDWVGLHVDSIRLMLNATEA